MNVWLLMGILRLNNPDFLEEVCIFLYFIVCVMLRRYLRICWRNKCWKIDIRTWMRRRISEWMRLGTSIRGMLLRNVIIRIIFMPWGGMSTLKRRRSWWIYSFQCPFRIQNGGTVFGLVWRITSSRKCRTTKLLDYTGLLINYFRKRRVGVLERYFKHLIQLWPGGWLKQTGKKWNG